MAYDPIIYGGSKSSVKGYASSRSKYFDELEAERKKKEKDTIAFGGSDTSSKAAKVEQSKGFWGGIKNTVAGSAKGAKDFMSATVGGGFEDLVGEVTGQNDIIRNNQQKTIEQNTDMVKLSGKKMNDASLSDEERERWKKLFHKYSGDDSAYKAAKEYNQGQIDRSTQAIEGAAEAYKTAQYIPGFSLGVEGVGTLAALATGDDGDVNKALIKLTQDKDWDKLSEEEKKAALTQRNIGGALSTLDVLPVAGKVAGTAVKTGVKTGMKAGIKTGVKEAVEAGAEAYGKSIASKTVGEVAGVGAKELAKQAGKSTAVGTVAGAGLGVGLNAVMGGDDWKGAAVQGAIGGAVGGFIGSPLDIDVKAAIKASGKNSLDAPDEVIDAVIKEIDATKAKSADEAAYLASRKAEFEQIKANRAEGLNDDGSRMINLDETNKNLQDMQAGNYSDDLYDITTTDGKAADPEFIQAATEKQVAALTAKRDEITAQVDAIESPAAREMAMANVNKLDDQIAAITSGDTKALMDTGDTGLSRTLNTERVRERFGQLQDDLAEGNFRQRQAQMEAEARTQPSRTFDSVSDDIDNLGAGGVAPEAITPRADFTDVDEVVRHPKLPEPLKRRAMSLARDRTELQKQLDTVMTPEKANQALDEMDAKYNQDLARIDSMPEPRRSAELERIDSEYSSAYDDIQSQLAADRNTVNQLTRVEEQINANMDEVLADSNIIKDSSPADFGTIDQELNARVSQEIEQETETAIFNRMSNEEGVPDAENISKTWAEAPEDKLEAGVTSPQVGALAEESIKDTFTNDGVKMYGDTVRALDATYTGLAMSSASHNLEKIFGKTGTELFGKIVKGYAHVSKANEQVAKTLTQVKKAFGGDKSLYAKAVDVLEGKEVDLKDFTPDQIEAIGKVRDLYEYGGRQVRKLAYNDVVHNFEKRVADGKFKYTVDEIKQFAKRDGTTVKVAGEKYGNISEYSKSDIDFLATNRAQNSTLDNYFPHMFDENGRAVEYPDSEYVKSNGDVKFGNMLHRLADEDSYSRDIIDVSARYFSGLNKKAYLEPVLRELDNAKLAIKAADSDANAAWKWIDKYQAQLKYNKQDAIGKSVNEVIDSASKAISKKIDKLQSKLSTDEDSGWNQMIDATLEKIRPNNSKIGDNHYRNLLSTQRQISTLAALGLSFRNAIQQTTQIGTTIGNLGVKDTTVGMVKYLKQRLNPTTMKQYTQLLDEHGITNAGIAREAYSDLLADGIGGAARSKGAKLSDALMIMTQKMDEFARGSTYEASLTANIRSGMPRAKAEALATADAARMNFMTSKVDMPIALNGDTVRSLSQFMTFSYKQAEAWKDLGIKSIKNPETGQFQLQPKQMSKLIQMMAFYGLAFEGMSQVAGIEPEDNIPFYGNIFGDSGIPKSPLVSTLFGMNENTPGLLDIAGGLINPEGDSDFEKEESRNATFEDFTNLLLRSFVPAGSQIKKSVEGYNSTQNDGVVLRDDRVRFIQNAKPDDMLRNPVLFGQYATDDGKEWVDKKFPTLSEKQSEILQAQKSKEAKQRAYDFYSGLKSVGTKSNVTPKVKDIMKTQPAKAERLIRDHNAKVQEAIQAYTSQYGELSEYEQDYLMQNYLITNGTLENMNED